MILRAYDRAGKVAARRCKNRMEVIKHFEEFHDTFPFINKIMLERNTAEGEVLIGRRHVPWPPISSELGGIIWDLTALGKDMHRRD